MWFARRRLHNGFTKREFVIKATSSDENSNYPNYVGLELIKDRCSFLDQYKIGEEVQVSFNINGRLWGGQDKPERCFTSLQVWRMSRVDQTENQQVDSGTVNNTASSSQQKEPPIDVSLSNDEWDDDIRLDHVNFKSVNIKHY